ncbi:MAG TPA: tRNA (guanosine(37)-N1)-methyltransferase TrmD [Solirubrobacterales bacterium]|nr:tRNA (guanosine(37)-N1)-methyltransferase TrmD [Solirubrobacterales bacterium]
MRLDIFSLFPEAFDWFQSQRSVQNALAEGNELRLFNYRDTTPLGAGQVDDAPYGGGAGMVLRVDVVDAALQAAYANGERPRVVLLSPTGRLLDDELADELTAEPHVAVLCGRYEGFDERVHEHFTDDEVSIGRYVLAGGELPAMVLADVVMRKLPGALGHERSAVEESFSQVLEGAPEYPHYTRPASYRGWGVPDVLLSGDHERVRLWRAEQSRARAEQLEQGRK